MNFSALKQAIRGGVWPSRPQQRPIQVAFSLNEHVAKGRKLLCPRTGTLRIGAVSRCTRVLAVLCFSWNLFAADVPKLPVPKSPYLPVVYRFADTMLEKGRDTYGPMKAGMFLSALNRETLAPLTNRPPAPEGVNNNERVGTKTGPLAGSNPQHDENLLRLLYMLSELSSKPKYREAADASLKWFLENTPYLLPWGRPLTNGVLEFSRPWLLWDRCFELAPDASRRFAFGLGQFDTPRPSIPTIPILLPREAGFWIRTWAVAYSKTRDHRCLTALEILLDRFEHPPSDTPLANITAASKLSMALDCDGASRMVPQALASRLQHFAEREDVRFCSLLYPLHIGKTADNQDADTAPLWKRPEGITMAQLGMMCLSRYDNTGRVVYRNLVIHAANAYLKSLPADSDDVWPGTFGQAISLQVGAWRHTADPTYLDRARKFADIAIEKFWGTNALPRASFKSEHYESITGADTLALALVELHLNILHITAVRCPPNTIDR